MSNSAAITTNNITTNGDSLIIPKLAKAITLLYYLASIFWIVSIIVYVYKYNSGEWSSSDVLQMLAALCWFFANVLQSIQTNEEEKEKRKMEGIPIFNCEQERLAMEGSL